ncbi:hypothetical protein D9758_011172 [Tetrapyrgos nigripes]|uniref:Fungal lipase-type domain-containing protein n=1 Tax=Tetrapyrgos nigripes TaxID=182062 RepID=A0A8H5D6H7_9AGAR|nr:hypothetical protein D9758_011172 [Tetrapyrgos nigripes]
MFSMRLPTPSHSRSRSRLLPLLTLCNLYLLHSTNASPVQHNHVNVNVVSRTVEPAPVQSIVDTLLTGNGSSNPTAEGQVPDKAGSVTVLSSNEVNGFTPFTHYASTAYCDPKTTINWSCGSWTMRTANCEANPDFQPIASGGNGGTEQLWYVGYDKKLNTVVVAHQGTDTSMLAAVATDALFVLSPLVDKSFFPGLNLGIQVHTGFKLAHERTANEVLSAVQTAMKQFGTAHVTVVGHSLGAALGLLDMVYFPLHLPSSTTYDFYGYGMPRVGNQAFANYVDANVKGVRRVNNKRDLVPVIPLRLMAFRHPSGEKHILDSGEWVACSGQENTAANCTLGYVPTIFNGDADDHSGPYDGITMGCD